MDITSEMAASLSAASTGDPVSVSVLRKTLDIEQQNAAQLLEALPPEPRPSAGSSGVEQLGQNIDVTA